MREGDTEGFGGQGRGTRAGWEGRNNGVGVGAQRPQQEQKQKKDERNGGGGGQQETARVQEAGQEVGESHGPQPGERREIVQESGNKRERGEETRESTNQTSR